MTIDQRPHRTRPRVRTMFMALVVMVVATGSGPLPALAGRPDVTVWRSGDPHGPTVLGKTVTFYGRGYGHGVGMSQHGARGRALAGQDSTTILAHYYRGAVLGSQDPATPIRVRILSGFTASKSRPLELQGRGGDWAIDGVSTVFPKDARLTATPTSTASGTTWRVVVRNTAGTILHNASTGSFRVRPKTASGVIRVVSKSSTYDEYRGVIRARLHTTSTKLEVINELPVETYLRGVVPAEMPSTWPSEALRAQAIAARSYASRRLRPGVSYYDVGDEASSQVYLGRETEQTSTDAAIDATAGRVLRSGSSIANTLFHSAGGGATEHNENAFVSASGKKVAGPVSYLRGSSDRAPDGSPYDATSPYATWRTATIDRAQLSAIFAKDSRTAVGSLTALDLRERGVSGRLIKVILVGSSGTRTVSGDVFRSVFNAGRPSGSASMRSTLVDTKPIP